MASGERELRFLPVITGFFVAVLLLTPPLDSKFIALGPFAVPGATLLFPFAFILNDVLTEVYGYARSRRVIWTGMACDHHGDHILDQGCRRGARLAGEHSAGKLAQTGRGF